MPAPATVPCQRHLPWSHVTGDEGDAAFQPGSADRACTSPRTRAIRRPHRDVTQKQKHKKRGENNCNPVTIRAVGGEANRR